MSKLPGITKNTDVPGNFGISVVVKKVIPIYRYFIKILDRMIRLIVSAHNINVITSWFFSVARRVKVC